MKLLLEVYNVFYQNIQNVYEGIVIISSSKTLNRIGKRKESDMVIKYL